MDQSNVIIQCDRWARIKMHSGPHLVECWFIWLSSWLTSDSVLVWLWPTSGKHLWTTQVPSFNVLQYVGRNKNVLWPTFGWVLVYMVWFWLTSCIVMGRLWPLFWQTGAECPSAIITCGMWAGRTCQVWANYGQRNWHNATKSK